MTDWNDHSIARSMQTLVENLAIWNWLNQLPSRWSGHRYRGEAAAVNLRLTYALGDDPSGFRWMHVHRINTGGQWTHPHNHEWPFCSLIVSGRYETEYWIQIPTGERWAASRRTCSAGDYLPFCDHDCFHRLRTEPDQEALTIVLTGEPFPPVYGRTQGTLPLVEYDHLEPIAVQEVLRETVDRYMKLRRFMKLHG